MSKNILILSSSPRRGGNSDTLCDEFMRGAIESGNQVEKISCATRIYILARGAAYAAGIRSPVRRKTMRLR